MDNAIEDANEKIIEMEDEYEEDQGYDSFGDEYDSEDISDEGFEIDSEGN